MFLNSIPYYTIYYPSSLLYVTTPIRLQELDCHSVNHVGDIAPQPVVAEPPDATPKNAIPRLGNQTLETNHYYWRHIESPQINRVKGFDMLAMQLKGWSLTTWWDFSCQRGLGGDAPITDYAPISWKWVSHKGGDTTAICDLLVLGNDTNGENEEKKRVMVRKISTNFGIYMHALSQHSANLNGAASKRAHGVDSLYGWKCTELGTRPYASTALQEV